MPRPALAVCFLTALLLGAPAVFANDCDADFVDLDAGGRISRFAVEVADTPMARAKGLMFRETLAPDAGMFFVYEQSKTVQFWMKNTRLPLDMLFFDRAGVLTRIHANARPEDATPIFGGSDIRFVLEINAGRAEALGLAPGARLRHPAVRQSIAAWPCG